MDPKDAIKAIEQDREARENKMREIIENGMAETNCTLIPVITIEGTRVTAYMRVAAK